MKIRIDESTFNTIKGLINSGKNTKAQIARFLGINDSTICKIGKAADYAEYKANQKAASEAYTAKRNAHAKRTAVVKNEPENNDLIKAIDSIAASLNRLADRIEDVLCIKQDRPFGGNE